MWDTGKHIFLVPSPGIIPGSTVDSEHILNELIKHLKSLHYIRSILFLTVLLNTLFPYTKLSL
jgi:hypothetical protein